MQNFSAKRKLSEILDEIGQDDALADGIEEHPKKCVIPNARTTLQLFRDSA